MVESRSLMEYNDNSMKNLCIHLLILLSVVLAGCQINTLEEHTVTPATSISPKPLSTHSSQLPPHGDVTPMPSYGPPYSAPNLQTLIETAKKDLAQRLSIPISQIIVIDARDVTWSNSSLGCPQPGMLYTEVLTPGHLILLNANGQNYEYHAGKNSDAFYCENPDPPVPGMSEDT